MKTVASAVLVLALALTVVAPTYAQPTAQQQQFPVIQLPAGYTIEKVADKLTYATSLTWDDQGRMYVVEAGGDFVEEPPPARILRVESGRTTEVANLTAKGIQASVVGLTWHNGALYFTHRDSDRTGAVSRMTMDGTITKLFSGIIDSQSEHQVNDIRVGPDGRMYLASGPAGNAAVIGMDNAASVVRSPMVHTTSCQDIVLTGQNFMTPDFRTPDQSDTALTGAYVPFGT
ncbi:MAG: sugar dehydrogenase, partial [Chloroflexota bacterium]|nr:sugar dehydrogenase [Chloroflexota bacterium]